MLPDIMTEAMKELGSSGGASGVLERADQAADDRDLGLRRGGLPRGADASHPERMHDEGLTGQRPSIPAAATATASGIDAAEASNAGAAAMSPATAAAAETATAVTDTSAGGDELVAQPAAADVDMVAAGAPVPAAMEDDLPGGGSHAISDAAPGVAHAAVADELASSGDGDRALQQHDRREGAAPSQGQGLAGSKRLLEASASAAGHGERASKRQQPAYANTAISRTSSEQELALAVLLQVLTLHEALADTACLRQQRSGRYCRVVIHATHIHHHAACLFLMLLGSALRLPTSVCLSPSSDSCVPAADLNRNDND
jgi:hypothetical protein